MLKIFVLLHNSTQQLFVYYKMCFETMLTPGWPSFKGHTQLYDIYYPFFKHKIFFLNSQHVHLTQKVICTKNAFKLCMILKILDIQIQFKVRFGITVSINTHFRLNE